MSDASQTEAGLGYGLPSDDETIADPSEGESRAEEALEIRPGSRIGRYRVLDVLGRGSMGVVYGAHDPELDRKVALKVIRFDHGRELRSGDRQARLIREAQALAQLNHPNVVVILDVGRFAEQVFIAMELVEGSTLRQWLRDCSHSWREVVDTFVDAGRGLVAAHEAELIHRDFKPDNVMVGSDGRVRVMDFGIARMLDPSEATMHEESTTSLTQGATMGTPAYMSPEQHAGGPVDARTDQFSFCVALYEGLYGVRPFRADNLAALAIAITEDPIPIPPPGSRVPAWVHAIVVRGLAKSSDERFPTMDALLRSLSRGPSRSRRLALALGVGVLGIAGAAVGVRELRAREVEAACVDAGARISEVWNPEVEQRVKRSLLDTGVSYAPDTWQRARPRVEDYAIAWRALRAEVCRRVEARGEWSAVQHARAAECLDERSSRLSALVEVLSQADRDVVFRAVGAAADLPDLSPCGNVHALARRTPLPDDPALRAKVARHRGELARARVLSAAGKYDAAHELVAQALLGAREADREALEIEALLRLGGLARVSNDFEGAQERLEDVFFRAERLGLDELALESATLLVTVLGDDQARYDEALVWARHAEGALDRLGPSHDLAHARLLEARGHVQHGRAAYAEALADHEQALSIRRAAVGDDHALVAMSLNGISLVHYAMGDRDQAFESLEEILAIHERTYGPDHPKVATALNNLGVAESEAGDPERGRVLLERSLDIRRRAFGEEHTKVANTLVGLADLASNHGRLQDALMLHRRALAIREKLLGLEHPLVAQSLNNLGFTLVRLENYAEAASSYERAFEIVRDVLGPSHPNTLLVRWGLGRTRYLEGRHARGREILDEVLEAHHDSDTEISLLARLDFEYARLMWERAEDRESLVTRARKASVGLRDAGADFAEEHARVEAWLAEVAREGSSMGR